MTLRIHVIADHMYDCVICFDKTTHLMDQVKDSAIETQKDLWEFGDTLDNYKEVKSIQRRRIVVLNKAVRRIHFNESRKYVSKSYL